jgi:predicted peptidase
MRNTTALLALAAMLAPAAHLSAQPAAASSAPPTQMVKQFQFSRTERFDVNYLLFLPQGYDAKAAKRWPLILFLHGAGERGTNIWKVATHGPPKNVTGHPDFPFIIVSPQCPEHQIWSKDALLALLDDITAKYAVDTKRIYLTGLSMGGYGTWDLGLSYPERFAAIVPICGGGQVITVLLAGGAKGQALKTLGVWAFHGGKDPVVPLEESQRMVAALKKAGVPDVKLTVYPEAQHDSWTETYKDPALYEWLLKHERGK